VEERLRALEVLLLYSDAGKPKQGPGMVGIERKYTIELGSRLVRLPGGCMEVCRQEMSDAAFRRLLQPLGDHPAALAVRTLVAKSIGLPEERGRRARANRSDRSGDAAPTALEKRRQVHQIDFLRARRTRSESKTSGNTPVGV